MDNRKRNKTDRQHNNIAIEGKNSFSWFKLCQVVKFITFDLFKLQQRDRNQMKENFKICSKMTNSREIKNGLVFHKK